MGHGHRRRSLVEHGIAIAEESSELAEIDAAEEAVAELLRPSTPPTPRIGVHPPGYHPYPKYATEEEAQAARDAANDAHIAADWDPDDPIVNRLLQPGDPDEPPPKSAGRSSGGGKNRKKPRKIVKATTPLDDPEDFEEVEKTRFRVYGLTRGESEYYHNRRGEAREVLKNLAAAIIRDKARPTVDESIRLTGKLNFNVYNLSTNEINTLRNCPGAARAELVRNAYAHDRDRIMMRDKVPSDKPTPPGAFA